MDYKNLDFVDCGSCRLTRLYRRARRGFRVKDKFRRYVSRGGRYHYVPPKCGHDRFTNGCAVCAFEDQLMD